MHIALCIFCFVCPTSPVQSVPHQSIRGLSDKMPSYTLLKLQIGIRLLGKVSRCPGTGTDNSARERVNDVANVGLVQKRTQCVCGAVAGERNKDDGLEIEAPKLLDVTPRKLICHPLIFKISSSVRTATTSSQPITAHGGN